VLATAITLNTANRNLNCAAKLLHKRADALTAIAFALILNQTRVGKPVRRSGRFRLSIEEKRVNKDQVKGRIKGAEGKIKEVTGHITGNKTLEEKGRVEKVAGDVQATYGDGKNEIKKNLKKGH
jgi:uncharacterized protein YjbJ (UPF0337 family)